MIPSFSLGAHPLGPEHPPFIIAELSGNHNASLDRALALIDAAAEAGAHAVKLQTYTADTLTLPVEAPGFRIDDPASLWHGRHLHELYHEAHTPWEWHAALFARARARGLVCFSTPFDFTAVDFLETLDPPAYKIASFECIDLPLVRRVAQTGRPLIISTGMATVAEIEAAVLTARAHGCRDLVLLKCTSAYPAPPEHINLRTLPHLRELFQTQVGLSDHTLGNAVAIAAVAVGAVVIEKHLTLSRAEGGVDAAFSMEPAELRALVQDTAAAQRALGRVSYGATAGDKNSLVHRRSLYVTCDLPAGATLSPANLRSVRPGFGLAPKHYDAVLGRRLRRAVTAGTPLAWELLD